MKTSKFFIRAVLCLALVTSFVSCNDNDDPEPVNEEELITDVVLTFTNVANANDTVVLTNNAPDGQDGTFTNDVQGNFTAGATYALTLSIQNSSETPAEDVLNGDIIPEGDEHFFVYAVNGINLTMTRDNDDVDGAGGSKLGVKTTWIAGAASTGSVRIQLIHEPTTTDDSDNFGSATGGSNDLNITFQNVSIQ
ncbi:type 1 periplasmic binding fold superfamily protein [Pseudotenacibaculum haliotis]|uniref:Type 1 periplasmic binding fold superfamily protein n=1 Tax=Pseudotenacibaculum haliotis TaxID=1862138 RepID=A0ABW5LTP5_9FLAO